MDCCTFRMEIWQGFSERRVFAEITIALGNASIGPGIVAAWGRPNAAVAVGLTQASPTKANSEERENKNGGRPFLGCRRLRDELWIGRLAFGYRIGVLAQEIESGGFLGRQLRLDLGWFLARRFCE